MRVVNICQFGAGRIGAVHAENISNHPAADLKWVVDIDLSVAGKLAEQYGAKASLDPQEALSDPNIDGVVIASSTDTHVDLILAAMQAGKVVFCEKPIDLNLQRVDEFSSNIAKLGCPLLIGFNRRFDPSFRALQRSVREGKVGTVEILKITSRDPVPPTIEYILNSGGLFRDMMIHDFDMARWILGEELAEVCATGSCLADEKIGQAGDVDTASVMMRTDSGVICLIDNSRRATYGYDQRIEVFGSEGMLQAGNTSPTTLSWWTDKGISIDKPPYCFVDRYEMAYQAELDHFIKVITGEADPLVRYVDGRQALALAEAAFISSEGNGVKVNSDMFHSDQTAERI